MTISASIMLSEERRKRVYDVIHGLSHTFMRASKRLLSFIIVCHRLNKQVGEWTSACIPCQTTKVQQHMRKALHYLQMPGCHFDHIQSDLVCHLLVSKGFICFQHVHMAGHFPKWHEAISIQDPTARICAQALSFALDFMIWGSFAHNMWQGNSNHFTDLVLHSAVAGYTAKPFYSHSHAVQWSGWAFSLPCSWRLPCKPTSPSTIVQKFPMGAPGN